VHIFITGGTTGIGLSLALEYIKRGHHVGICGRDLSKLGPDLLKSNPNLKAYKVDVLDYQSLESAVEEFCGKNLDMMIANAGRSVGSKTKIPNFEIANEVIDINVKGVLNTFDVALKRMLPRKSGHLVATASVAGLVGLPGAAAYSASKSAVLKICESYQLDLKNFGIHVTAILPGFIDTPLTRKNSHKMPFLMDSETAALKIIKAIESKKVRYIFPWQMKVVMTALEKMPRGLYRFFMGSKLFNYSEDK